jgi:1-hydroxycarotenoid 3,4-desaturase
LLQPKVRVAVHPDRIAIVGSGVGALSAAVALASRGCKVTVFERAAGPGGKLRELAVAGRRIDSGPTVLTMRWVFEEIFADAGSTLDAHLTLEPLEVLARHYWGQHEPLDLFADEQRTTDAIGRFAGAAEAHGYRQFCERARNIFETLDGPFMRAAEPSMLKLITGVGLRRPTALLGIEPFATLWNALGSYFKDARLCQLFGRYATYCGASPFQAPATLMLIAHVERMGVWSVKGGMHQIAEAMSALAIRHGAAFRYNTHVQRIITDRGRASGVELADGERIDADVVLFGGDVAALSTGLLGPAVNRAAPATKVKDRSLSALTISAVADLEGFPLPRHTVFFSRDYQAEFQDICGAERLPSDPTVYVCAQDRGGTDAPPSSNPERLFLIINAPARGDTAPLHPEEIERCKTATCQTLARAGLKLTLEPTTATVTGPAEFAQLFPATGGALYGMASHGWQASFRRPSARSKIQGLYLAGGSVHPGPGVPMAAMSGRLAASRIMQDLASMRRSTPVAMRGGILTR